MYLYCITPTLNLLLVHVTNCPIVQTSDIVLVLTLLLWILTVKLAVSATMACSEAAQPTQTAQ